MSVTELIQDAIKEASKDKIVFDAYLLMNVKTLKQALAEEGIEFDPSLNYALQGYMVVFDEAILAPKLHLRQWQPDKNPTFAEILAKLGGE